MPRHYRVIRKVVRLDRAGKVKKVRDYREGIEVERIKAQAQRKCNYDKCAMSQVIRADRIYYKVTQMIAAGRRPYLYEDYHFNCLPPKAQPMKRFFNA